MSTPSYRGSTSVTRWPSRPSASGRAAATSASPPVFAYGCASDVIMSIDNGSEPSGRFSETMAVGADALDDIRGARGFESDLPDRAGFSAAGRGLCAERVVFGAFGAVLE